MSTAAVEEVQAGESGLPRLPLSSGDTPLLVQSQGASPVPGREQGLSQTLVQDSGADGTADDLCWQLGPRAVTECPSLALGFHARRPFLPFFHWPPHYPG